MLSLGLIFASAAGQLTPGPATEKVIQERQELTDLAWLLAYCTDRATAETGRLGRGHERHPLNRIAKSIDSVRPHAASWI